MPESEPGYTHGAAFGAERLQLFIAMVSGDVIVLAKLVRTLCPRHVLLFSTPYARRRGWEDSARVMLQGIRGRLVEDFHIEPLPDGDLTHGLSSFRQCLDTAVSADTPPGAFVALDCTTGQGIFRILGYEFVRQAAAQRDCPLWVVYCDGDSGSVLIAAPTEVHADIEARPIQFQFSDELDPLADRFAMYGVSPTGSTSLWPKSMPESDLQGVSPEMLLSLFDTLCSSKSLRAFFHSYWNRVKTWKQRETRETVVASDHMRTVVDELVLEFGQQVMSLEALRDDAAAANKVQATTGQVLRKSAGVDPQNHDWIQDYLQDQELRDLNRLLQEDLRPKVQQILWPCRRRELDRAAVNTAIARHVSDRIRRLVRSVREELARLAQAQGQAVDPQAISPDEHRSFREHALEDKIHQRLREFLIGTATKTADLFELAAGCAVARIVENDSRLKSAVTCVQQNVVFHAGSRAVCELDSLVLFQTGDVFAFEAKTHYINADRKKIEANIKQLRDFGGAYSGYCLVYPLTGSEIDSLAAGDEKEIRDLESLGMSDAHKWAEHIRTVRQSRDQRIVGIDDLAAALCRAAKLDSRPE